MYELGRCRIWNTPANVCRYDGNNKEVVDSPRAGGKYDIYSSGWRRLENGDDHLRARLTSWVILRRRMGDDSPVVDRGVIDEIERTRNLPVHERVDRLLRYIAEETHIVGEEISLYIPPEDRLYPNMLRLDNLKSGYWRNMQARAYSESSSTGELDFLLDYAKTEGWIEGQMGEYVVTVNGYSRLAELDKIEVISSRAFVAMWFDPSLHDAWEQGIRLGIKDAGYDAIRIDNEEHLNKIDDEIIAEIRRARFVVADFTQGRGGARGGVYYEAGFANGLDIPVIFTCRKDKLKKVHFDTRNYNHIVWENPEELRRKLSKRIAAVIGEGPIKRRNEDN